MSNLKDYIQEGANWRKNLRINTRRTNFVIVTFILIYAALGMFVDLYMSSQTYPQASLSEIFHALITFHIFPISTVVLSAVALIAILATFAWHDRLMLLGTNYYEITPTSARTSQETQLYNVIEEMKIAAHLNYMPKIYVIEASYMNAFATGYSEKSSMVAITQGLITKLNREELQAVMAHELSHIRHLDIKLTLMAAVLSNITLIVTDLLFRSVIYGRDEQNTRSGLFGVILLLRYLLPVITVLLILYLSRTREYMADAGCVELMRDNQPLASALMKISDDHQANADKYSQEYQSTPHENVRREAYIYDPKEAGIITMESFSDLFSTHPSISKRLAALGFHRKGQS